MEWVFSGGHQLLSYTRNRLSPSSVRAILCFCDWSKKDLVHMPELVEILEDCQSKKHVLEVDLTVEA